MMVRKAGYAVDCQRFWWGDRPGLRGWWSRMARLALYQLWMAANKTIIRTDDDVVRLTAVGRALLRSSYSKSVAKPGRLS